MRGRGYKYLFQISGGPAVQGGGDHVPALLKQGDESRCLVRGWRVGVLIIVPVEVGISFPHPEVEPVVACTDHMVEQLAYRPLIRRKRGSKLFRGQWCDGMDQGVLIVFPPWFVKHSEGRYLFGH